MREETKQAIKDLLKYFDRMSKLYGRTPQVRDAKLLVDKLKEEMRKEPR